MDVMKSNLSNMFVYKADGLVKEFLGSKIDLSRDANGLGTAKFTQPVLVQKLFDEYQVEAGEKRQQTPANYGLVLVKADTEY